METPETDWAEVDVPLAVVDLDEADVLASQRVADVHPPGVPANPAVGPDAADRVVARIPSGRRRAGKGRDDGV